MGGTESCTGVISRAFNRVLAQGLEERSSWDRYLRLEGEQSICGRSGARSPGFATSFAAAARREREPGTARLILPDPERFTSAPALLSLAEFAAERGMGDFSEAERIGAYEAADATEGGEWASARPSRRAAPA